MNLLQIHSLKFDMEKPIPHRYPSLNKIANLPIRTLQFSLAFFFFFSWSVSRSSSYFPAAVDLLRFILHRFSLLAVNHHFGFLLGNLIIVTLFVNSGRRSAGNPRGNEIRRFAPPRETETVSDAKSIVPAAGGEELAARRTESESRKFRRTRSEEFEAQVRGKIKLRRSETEARREMWAGKRRIQVEDLSNEEFQRKVEAFIERQQRFLREESLSMTYRCSA